MKLSKKIFAFVLVVSMMLSMTVIGQAVTFSDVGSDHERYEAINELADRGIINGYTDGTFQPDKAVTRAEMAKLIAVLFNITEQNTVEKPFTDVDENCWALNYIVAVKNLGIINGFPDGSFQPDAEVTYEQAIKMIVCALNYEEPAKAEFDKAPAYTQANDWAYGYRKMASQLGITDNVGSVNVTAPAARGIIAQLFYNSLNVAPAVRNEDGSYEKGDTPLGESNNKTYKQLKNAQVISTPKINVDPAGQLVNDGRIALKDSNGQKYAMIVGTLTTAFDYIGRYVDVGYEETEKGLELKSIKPVANEKITKIDITKIQSVTSTSIVYYTDDNYSKTETVNINNPTVIYNDRALIVPGNFKTLLENDIKYSAPGDIAPALSYFGEVVVTNSGSNSLVDIDTYKSYYVEKSTTKDVTFEGAASAFDMDLTNTGRRINKKTSLTDKGNDNIDGTLKNLGISANSVVNLKRSDVSGNIIGGEVYYEYIAGSSSPLSGMPAEAESIANPYDGGKVKIGSQTYIVANQTAYKQLQVNSTSKYYTDAKGNIVKVTSTSSGSIRFGFYTKGSAVTDSNNTVLYYNVSFYNPENNTTFTVRVDKQADADGIYNAVSSEDATLFLVKDRVRNSSDWLKINSTTDPATEAEVKAFDTSVTAFEFADARNTAGYVEKTGTNSFKFTSVGSLGTITPTKTANCLIRPENSSDITYKTLAMVQRDDPIDYKNPEYYKIQRGTSPNVETNTIIVADAFKGLTDESAVYIVDGLGSTTTVGGKLITQINCFDFRGGGSVTVKILADVQNTLALQEGDVFTYYKDSDTSGADIDKNTSVYVLLRASKRAGNTKDSDGNPVRDFSGLNGRLTHDDNASNTTEGFKYFGIRVANLSSNERNYSLQLPVWYDDQNKNLYLAKKGANTLLPDMTTISSLKTSLADLLIETDGKNNWNGLGIYEKLKGSSVTFASTSNSNIKAFVYDTSANDKLTSVAYDSLPGLLEEAVMLADSAVTTDSSSIETAAKACSLVYTYYSNGDETLNTIYIIK